MKDMLQRSLRSGLLVSLAALGVACGSDNLYQLKNQAAHDADLNLVAGTPISELTDFSIRLVEQYAVKDDMSQQFSLLSLCKEIDADKMICALTDKDGSDAKVIGVETIISESAFEKLSEEEKAKFHSHKNELTSGRMMIESDTEADAKALMEKLSSTFGKAELFMMPGTDKMLESALLLTAIEGGSFGITGGSKDNPADQSGDLAPGSKSADQNITSGEKPAQSQGAIEQPKAEEPKGEEPKSDEPTQAPSSDEPKSSMTQGAMPAQSQGSYAAQSQSLVKQSKAEEPKSEEPKSDEPKGEEPKGEEPVQGSHHVAGQNAIQGSMSAIPSASAQQEHPASSGEPSKEAPAHSAIQD